MDIKSSDNKKLKLFRLLHKRKYREQYQLVPLDGRLLVEEALNVEAEMIWILYDEEFKSSSEGLKLIERIKYKNIPCYLTSRKLIEEASTVSTSQGIICVAKMPSYSEDLVIKRGGRLLILDSVQDPGNLGTLFRTSLAGGMTGVVCTKGSVDLFNPKTLRSTMGAVFNLPHLKEIDPGYLIQVLQELNIPIYCCDPGGEVLYYDVDFAISFAVVIGNESRGISPIIKEKCSQIISIPLEGSVESLNASVAGAIIIYEALRQARSKGL